MSVPIGDDFELGGIALGTMVTIGVYHLARLIAPKSMKDAADGASLIYDAPGIYESDGDDPAEDRA